MQFLLRFFTQYAFSKDRDRYVFFYIVTYHAFYSVCYLLYGQLLGRHEVAHFQDSVTNQESSAVCEGPFANICHPYAGL